jgi:hypothetical protein
MARYVERGEMPGIVTLVTRRPLAAISHRRVCALVRGWRIHAVVWQVCEPESVMTFMPRQRLTLSF